MHKEGLTFSADQFSRIFPFFILINKELEIIACGNSLKLLFEDCNKTIFLISLLLNDLKFQKTILKILNRSLTS